MKLSMWRLSKPWGHPKSSKSWMTMTLCCNNHGDFGIPLFKNPLDLLCCNYTWGDWLG